MREKCNLQRTKYMNVGDCFSNAVHSSFSILTTKMELDTLGDNQSNCYINKNDITNSDTEIMFVLHCIHGCYILRQNIAKYNTFFLLFLGVMNHIPLTLSFYHCNSSVGLHFNRNVHSFLLYLYQT